VLPFVLNENKKWQKCPLFDNSSLPASILPDWLSLVRSFNGSGLIFGLLNSVQYISRRGGGGEPFILDFWGLGGEGGVYKKIYIRTAEKPHGVK
jgi:hypothetical protein